MVALVLCAARDVHTCCSCWLEWLRLLKEGCHVTNGPAQCNSVTPLQVGSNFHFLCSRIRYGSSLRWGGIRVFSTRGCAAPLSPLLLLRRLSHPQVQFCISAVFPADAQRQNGLAATSQGLARVSTAQPCCPISTSPPALTFGALLLAGPADILELCFLWYGLRSSTKPYPFGHISFSCLQNYSLQKLCSVHLFFTKKVLYS